MKTFIIECTWTMCGSYHVQAESEEQALEIAEEMNLPDGEYIDGSYHADFIREEGAEGHEV